MGGQFMRAACFHMGRSAALLILAAVASASSNTTTWHVVWVGGQSNSIGTNSQKSGFPTFPTTDRIQMFCWSGEGCQSSSFAAAKYPIYGEFNVGFSLTFANLLLPTLPPSDGIVLLNTGVGGTGFIDNRWVVPDGPLTQQSISAVDKLAEALPTNLGGTYSFHSMLWHQGEDDAGDNRQHFQAGYCQYLQDDLSRLVDFFRANFKGASVSTPFMDGGMLPYWVDAFNGTQAVLMGHEYFRAYQRATELTSVVPSARTRACGNATSKATPRCG